jgi:hypothetical protein
MYAENAPAGNSDLDNAPVFERCGVGYAVQYRDRRLESFEARHVPRDQVLEEMRARQRV